jgi:3-oxoacyl-[acyl-carrier protein] reductase
MPQPPPSASIAESEMRMSDDSSGNSPAPRVALVTGASRGIGAAVAERLARDGFAVVVNYAGAAATLLDAPRHVRGGVGRAVAVRADVGDPADVRRLFDAAEAAFGGVDVLVNNAGVMRLSPIAESDDALFDRQVAVNLRGTFNGLREGARRLRAGGRIVSFSTSVLGLRLETYGVYAATKAAVEALTGVLAKELRGRLPGPTATALFLEGKSPELVDRMAKMNPLERLGTPEDIAAAVAFLVGPDGGWINGQVLRANGGMV